MLSQPFRAFFPLAALAAAALVLLWALGLAGQLPLPPNPSLWHAHEMLFGFTVAVILGFTLTAAGNWTGRATTTPLSLGLLIGLWLSARLLALAPWPSTQWLSRLIDVPLLFVAAALMAQHLIRARNLRNYVFVPFLGGLAIANLVIQVQLHNGHAEPARQLLHGCAWFIGFLMVFMGGRVIPFFAGRRLEYKPRELTTLNWLSTLSALACAASMLGKMPSFTAILAGLSAVSTALRWLLWSPQRSLREPMLWILQIGYLWLIVAYGLLATQQSGQLNLPPTAPIHALMTGALGCLGLGMMTRVSLGHSGRIIRADFWMTLSFITIICAGLLRIGAYLSPAKIMLPVMSLSALCWAAAFVLFAGRFIPWLWRTDTTQ